MAMRVVLSGGGTAGHITPAIALAEELVSRGDEVYFAGGTGDAEARLVPEAGIPFKAFKASGFDRARPWTLLSGIYRVLASTNDVRKWFSELRPDAVVGFGGYVSLPVCRAAKSMRIPFCIHEQNSIMGMANSYLSRFADAVCLTYAGSIEGIKGFSGEGRRVVQTGNPVRRSFFSVSRSEARVTLKVPEDSTMLLVFGGSLGAHHINEAVCALKDELLARKDLVVMHVSGRSDFIWVKEALKLDEDGLMRWRVVDYQNDMPRALSAADAVISRSGASSVAEISALGVPSILVPYPYARADHQRKNAHDLVSAGAAILIDDDDLDSDLFRDCVLRLVGDRDLRAKMRKHAISLKSDKAAAKLADVVHGLVI